MEKLMTVHEVAKILQLQPDTIYKKVRRGEIPCVRFGQMVIRFRREDIERLISTGVATDRDDGKPGCT